MKFLKNKKRLMYTGAILIFIALAYFIFKDDLKVLFYRTKRKVMPPNESETPKLNLEKDLSKGSEGAEVKHLQSLLLAHGEVLPKHQDDGVFGDETETALINFLGVPNTTLSDFIESAKPLTSENSGIYNGQVYVRPEGLPMDGKVYSAALN